MQIQISSEQQEQDFKLVPDEMKSNGDSRLRQAWLRQYPTASSQGTIMRDTQTNTSEPVWG